MQGRHKHRSAPYSLIANKPVFLRRRVCATQTQHGHSLMTVKIKRNRGSHVSLAHLVAIVIVALSVFLMVDFGIKAAAFVQVSQEARTLQDEVNRQLANQKMLQERLNYVQGDAYVAEVARTQLKWSQPGETVVVIMNLPPDSSASPAAGQSPTAQTSSPPSSWPNWWALFFDTPPPRIF